MQGNYPDPSLSKYDPLDCILFADDFDTGMCGWSELIGNYEGSLDTILPPFRDLRPPMLSSATMWDTGTAGSLSGTYSLKLATRARAGHLAVAVKRATWRQRGRVQVECYFAVKPEPSALTLGDHDVGAFGVFFDFQDSEERAMPHLRYCNVEDGAPRYQWQYRDELPSRHVVGHSGEIKSFFHLDPTGWKDIPNAQQRLCYNELPTKFNWHYLRFTCDLHTMNYAELQCNDRTFDLTDLSPIRAPTDADLWCMLNTAFFVETATGRRAFLYLDSVVVSLED